MKKLDKEQIQVLATLAYTDQFQYPLSADEVYERLVRTDRLFFIGLKSKKVIDRKRVKNVLNQLVAEQKVVKQGIFYALNNSEESFQIRELRQNLSKKNLKNIKKLLAFVKKISWIKAIGITGSQAMNNISSGSDDVDFIVITTLNRLWLVRPLIILYSFLAGKKTLFWPLKGVRPRDKWCFNLWLDESALALSEKKKNFYTAYEIMQIRWVYETEKIANIFQNENLWVQEFLPNYIIKKNTKQHILEEKTLLFEKLNKLMFKIQFEYLRWKLNLKKAGANKNHAFLHLGDMKKRVYKRWRDRLSQIIEVKS